MNEDVIEGKWEQLKGKVKQVWAQFTDDDIKLIGGKKDQLLGKLQERYGYGKEQAARELERFITDNQVTTSKKNEKAGCCSH